MRIVSHGEWRIKLMPEQLVSEEWVPAAHAGIPGKLRDRVVPMKRLRFTSPETAEENTLEQARRWINDGCKEELARHY